MIVFGDENGFGIGSAVAVGVDGFTKPDVVVIVGVFDDLNSVPSLCCGIVFLFGDFRQTISIVPLVQFALGGSGVGFGRPISFCVVGVSIIVV